MGEGGAAEDSEMPADDSEAEVQEMLHPAVAAVANTCLNTSFVWLCSAGQLAGYPVDNTAELFLPLQPSQIRHLVRHSNLGHRLLAIS